VKSLFLANMSHEIRTPLNSIMGFTELLKNSTSQFISEEEKIFFDAIKSSGQRLMHTVHEILDMSQIEAGTYKMNFETFDLCQLVKDIVNECDLMAHYKKLKLEYHHQPKSVFIRADYHGITRAVRNIIDNAIKYTEQGKITVSLKQSSGQYVLTINDTGIGISEDYLENLFETFSQESEGFTKKFQGIGLGMAIAKRHLDLNKVGIQAKSSMGVGTTVILTFKPAEENCPENLAENENKEDNSTPFSGDVEKPQVLLVEDDSDTQKLTEFCLKEKYDIYFAVSVEEAKQQLKKYKIALVLLDLSLIGNKDGLDLVCWMRKTKDWKRTPVIVTTAHAFASDREKCLAAGCDDYLSKPIKSEKLLEKIRKHIRTNTSELK
ncbi:MAG: response regulator, partial [Simkaniaceae bacterium]|nr:response regulator [Simkaniaceae bacterium]